MPLRGPLPDGQAIAPLLGVHRNTIYADLHAFHRHGFAALQRPRDIGAPPRLTQTQIATICRLSAAGGAGGLGPGPAHPCKAHATRQLMRVLGLTWTSLPKRSPDDNPVETIFSDQQMILDNSNDPDGMTTRERISAHLRGRNRRRDRWIRVWYLPHIHKK